MKFGQLIMKKRSRPDFADGTGQKTDAAAGLFLPAASEISRGSSVCAEGAAECVGLLHQALAGHDLDDVVVVLLVLHVLFHLALDDDDRADALVIFGTIMQ